MRKGGVCVKVCVGGSMSLIYTVHKQKAHVQLQIKLMLSNDI